MKELTQENIKEFGIRNYHTLMDNGEKRFRLISDKDNTSYIRTEASSNGGIQKSHYHTKLKEMYIVQKGTIDIYEYQNNTLNKITLKEKEYYLINENIPHNVYMHKNAITHTVKFGSSSNEDWYSYEELDEIIKNN